jgi:hypothetical protein|tara:strand:- start:24743 stop:24934 length:192 start_codon:yes stop_codon:yes gene_type:complete
MTEEIFTKDPNMTVEVAMQLIVENLTPNGDEKLEAAQTCVIEALGLVPVYDSHFNFKFKKENR